MNEPSSKLKKLDKLSKSQLKILSYLSGKEGGKARFSEIVEDIGLSKATVSRNLKLLVEKGLIQRIVDKESNEYPPPVYYQITDKGRQYLKENIDFDVDIDLKKLEGEYQVLYKLDPITNAVLEGYTKAQNIELADLLKAIIYLFGWGSEYKYMKTGKRELTEEDVFVLSKFLRKEFINLLKEYWSLDLSVDELEKDLKELEKGVKLGIVDKDVYEKLSKSIDLFKNRLKDLRNKIKKILFETLDSCVVQEGVSK